LLQDVADLSENFSALSTRAVIRPSRVLASIPTQECFSSTKPATRALVSFTLI
jgi:hypothetical protein